MKTKTLLQGRKISREELKNVKAGDRWGNRVCCTYNEENFCCEWASDFMNCRGIQC